MRDVLIVLLCAGVFIAGICGGAEWVIWRMERDRRRRAGGRIFVPRDRRVYQITERDVLGDWADSE